MKQFKINKNPKFKIPELLLHPTIPKPLHGVNPRTVLGKEWWDEKRKDSYLENNYCCWACGIHKLDAKYYKWLEAHESYKIDYKIGRIELEEVVALCHCCHNYIHKGRLERLYFSGKIKRSKLDYIINHGAKIIIENGIHIIGANYCGEIAPWEEWHLKIENKKYYSKFKNYEDWKNYYG